MSPRPFRPVIIALAAFAALAAAPAEALVFHQANQGLTGGKRVLWVRDCGIPAFRDAPCSEAARSFSTGDAATLRAHLRRGRYDEIWLWSGGGNLDEGVKIGEVLRDAQATVRVPKGARCISACTVAFMGGLFRFVDPGATYEVHAYSGYSNGLDPALRNAFLAEPTETLRTVAQQERVDARRWAARLHRYFQLSLVRLGQRLPASRLPGWAAARVAARYSPKALEEDAFRIRREGEAAAQEILMRIERDSMALAIEELREMLPELGPRAEPALRMLEAMFSSRITMTASLSPETLLRMGYVTRVIERE